MSKYPGRIVTDLAPAGYSVAFDGTGDYLTVADSSTLEPSNSNFTIECWIYPTATGSFLGVFSKRATNANYSPIQVLINSGTMILSASTDGSSWAVNQSASSSPSLNTWSHIAVVRNGTGSNNLTLYLNGTSVATGSVSSTALVNNTGAWAIGADAAAGTGNFSGYISNFRYVLGTAIYTAAFTPPTQLFNIPNTQLLTCNSPAIIDQSNNAFAITVNGNAAVSTFTPFTAYVPYNPALGASTPGVWTLDEALQAKGTRQWNMYDPRFNLTTLLLHGNGANNAQNNTFVDSSSNAFPITRNPASGPNAPTQGSFSPFSQTPGYWGINFNRGYVSSTLTGQAAGTGSFTYEMFFNITMREPAVSNVAALFSTRSSGTGADGIDCQITSTGQVQVGTSAAILFTSSAGIVRDGVWYHLAIVRNGTTNCTVYLNGVSIGTFSANTNYSSTALYLGVFGGINDFFRGFISNFRYTRDAVYTSTFTVATAPLQPITNTQFLTAQSNRFLDTSANGFTVTPVVLNGSTSISPFGPFYSPAAYTPATVSGSGYFDGTGDYLSIADNAAFDFGSGDFTISAWIYPTTSGGAIIDQGGGGTSTNRSFEIFMSNASTISNAYITSGGSYQSQYNLTGTTTPYAWNFIEFTRSSGTIYLFVNGVQQSSASANITVYNSTANVFIGDTSQATGNNFRGYISDVRVRKGTGASSSTVPTTPLTNVSNTVLLCNFTNAGIVDSTAKNVVETVADAKISTAVSKFGGSSIFFDGTGDYLQTAQNQLFNLGASDFTIEFWIYPTSFSVTSYPLYSASARSKADCVAFEINTGGVLNVYVTALGGAAWSIISAGNIGTLTLNTWSHVAFVRNGPLFRGYLNGVQSGLTTSSTSNIASFDGWNIGYNGVSGNMTGYLDDIRITRSARYIANFTPQTSQWQDE